MSAKFNDGKLNIIYSCASLFSIKIFFILAIYCLFFTMAKRLFTLLENQDSE